MGAATADVFERLAAKTARLRGYVAQGINEFCEAMLAFGNGSPELAHYDRCRAKGTSHRMAMMLAGAHAPGMNRTDDRWRKPDPTAKRYGIKANGIYQAGLARYPGDPKAVVQSRAEAKRVAREHGLTILDGPANEHGSVQQRRKDARKKRVSHGG